MPRSPSNSLGRRLAALSVLLLPALLVFAVLANRLIAEGPLAPPTGSDPKTGPIPPIDGPGGDAQPSMKTLHQIEPRFPIDTLPFDILTPGSYYLTRNLDGTGPNADISVFAEGVTIDLNGFRILGNNSNAAIEINDNRWLHVRNGSFRDCSIGVDVRRSENVVLESLRFVDCDQGISISTTAVFSVRDCIFTGHSFHSIDLANATEGSVRDCVISGGEHQNDTGGIFMDFACDRVAVTDCLLAATAGDAIEVRSSAGLIESNHIVGAQGAAIYVADHRSVAVRKNSVWGDNDGIVVTSGRTAATIEENLVSSQDPEAIRLTSTASGTRVTGNHVSESGIMSDGGNQVTENTVFGGTITVDPVNDTFGTIISTAGAIGTGNGHENFALPP